MTELEHIEFIAHILQAQKRGRDTIADRLAEVDKDYKQYEDRMHNLESQLKNTKKKIKDYATRTHEAEQWRWGVNNQQRKIVEKLIEHWDEHWENNLTELEERKLNCLAITLPFLDWVEIMAVIRDIFNESPHR